MALIPKNGPIYRNIVAVSSCVQMCCFQEMDKSWAFSTEHWTLKGFLWPVYKYYVDTVTHLFIEATNETTESLSVK